MDDRKSTIFAPKFKTVSNTRYIAYLFINFLLMYKSIRKVTLKSTLAIAKTVNMTKSYSKPSI